MNLTSANATQHSRKGSVRSVGNPSMKLAVVEIDLAETFLSLAAAWLAST